MTDLATLNSWLAALKKARASGVRSVRHGDTETTFRSMTELNQAIAAVEREIAEAGGTTRRKTRRAWQSSKGL